MNFESLSNHIGEGIVIDIGTGDGRFVSAAAKANPTKFFIGIDANVKPLEKLSMKATRKPGKGGLHNALFVQAAVEDLPEELTGCADEIHIHFPWGSLLKAVTGGDLGILASLRRIASSGCLLEVVIGIDVDRDRSEIERLGIAELDDAFILRELKQIYRDAGFQMNEYQKLPRNEWSRLETSWAKRLGSNNSRKVTYLVFETI